YAHMARFVSALSVSEVTRREGNTLEVHQAGEAWSGLFGFPFETLRAVTLAPPRQIRSRLMRRNFKSYDYTTTITPGDHGVMVVNHGEYVPYRWVPPVIGPALIAAQTRKHYAELRAEILRRMGSGSRSSVTEHGVRAMPHAKAGSPPG
ncbi:MAG: hypothetical protein ACREDY_00575, partial [Bradyrhizobium sp.]